MLSAKLRSYFLRDPRRDRDSLFRIAAGLFFLIILSSQGEFDPDPLNLARPLEGTQNWLRIPGALVAGLTKSIFGWFSAAIPFVFIFLQDKSSKNWATGHLKDFFRLLAANSCFSLMFAAISPAGKPRLAEIAGIWGHVSVETLEPFPGTIVSLLILFGFAFRHYKSYELNPLILRVVERPLIQPVKEAFAIGRRLFYDVNLFKSLFSGHRSGIPETRDQPKDKNKDSEDAKQRALEKPQNKP